MFWLPPDFEPQCHDVKGNQVSIGFRNGRVIEKLDKKLVEVSQSLETAQKERQQRDHNHEAGEQKQNLIAWKTDLRKQQDDLNAKDESIERRLTKWKSGMIEMNDMALRRLQSEAESIAVKKVDLQSKLAEYYRHRQELQDQYDAEYQADKERLRSLSAEKEELKKQLACYKERKADLDQPKTPVMDSGGVDVEWLNDNIGQEDSSDEEDLPEPVTTRDKVPSRTKEPSHDRPEGQPQNPPSPMAASSSPSDNNHPPIPDNKEVQTEWCCVRKAWRPPEIFQWGSNYLSFAYQFFLGPSTAPFYTISLVPEDLGSYETAQVGWTVIAKTWATPKGLTAAGWPYTEDLVGNVWIHRDLNWVCETCTLFST